MTALGGSFLAGWIWRILRRWRSAERIQRSIEAAELRPNVPDVVRARFEMVRTAFTYGTFAYELFSVAEAQGRLLYEMALGERFVETYG